MKTKTKSSVDDAAAQGQMQGVAAVAGWFGGDSPDEPSSAWTELRNRMKAGEHPQEYRCKDGTRGWLLYTMKQHGRVAVLWEHNRHEVLYRDNDPRLLPPNT